MKKLFLIILLFLACSSSDSSENGSKDIYNIYFYTFPINEYQGEILVGKKYKFPPTFFFSIDSTDTMGVYWTLKNDTCFKKVYIKNLDIDKYYSVGDTIKWWKK